MLKCATSLWSADLANLGAEIQRIEPYSERFHFDVADGHHMKALLFFPDLVRALRKYTHLPFEIHLYVTDPLSWVAPFVEAGADRIIFGMDSTRDPAGVIKAIKEHGKEVGISLLVSEPLDLLEPYWNDLDTACIIGTDVGQKGLPMEPHIPDKIRRARQIIASRGYKAEIEVDGGIRRNSVPLIHAAGADTIVPGSLIFNEDPQEMRKWLASL
jgi:ribulose-phosphate 3-epimerase